MRKHHRKLATLLLSTAAIGTAGAAGPVTVGSPFQVNTNAITYLGFYPAVAVAQDGSFVAAWYAQEGSDTVPNLYARRFSASGTPLGPEVLVNATPVATTNLAPAPTVVTDAQGNFAVGWLNASEFASVTGAIKLRLFHADGTPRGSEFCPDSTCTTQVGTYSLAMDDAGDFAVVRSLSSATSSTVDAIRFAADGTPRGSMVAASVDTPKSSAFSSTVFGGTAAMNPATGELAVGWAATSDFIFLAPDQYPDTIQGQSLNLRRFAANGQALGAPIGINACSGYAVFLVEHGCFYPAGSGYPGVGLGPGAGLQIGPGVLRYTSQGITTAWSEIQDTLNTSSVETYNTYAKSILPALGFGIGHPVSLPADFLNHLAHDGTLALDEKADLVAVWPHVVYSGSPATASITLYAQVFDPNGATLGPALTLGPAPSTQLPQEVRGLSFNHGNFVTVWGAGNTIYAQRYTIQ
ncbi:MAG: hypothetical protein P4L83_00405 [Nevskia sp.]|nr:hypothetical protein [Nevskia sp.]